MKRQTPTKLISLYYCPDCHPNNNTHGLYPKRCAECTQARLVRIGAKRA